MVFRTTLLVLLAALLASPAQARVYIDINKPGARKIPLAVTRLVALEAGQAENTELAVDLPRYISQGLDLYGLFIMLDPSGFLEQDLTAGLSGRAPLDYPAWRKIGAELLIKGGYRVSGNELTLELYLFDVYDNKRILGKAYTRTIYDAREMAMLFMNEVIAQLTEEKGVFGSLIAFVGHTGPFKEIFLAKFGREDVLQFTHNRSISRSPVFGPGGDKLIYLSYKAGRPDMYLANLAGGEETRLNPGPTLYLTPAYTLSGRLTAAISGNHDTNIHFLGPDGVQERPLTFHSGINISPTFSPDGKSYAFVSNRSGSPQIYVADLSGGEARRITFEGDYNTDPQWSPRGDRIVYVAQEGGRFNICSMRPDGTDRRQLTDAAADDVKPSFSPDGRLIVFSSSRLGKSALFTMTADGQRQTPLGLSPQMERTSPCWSPMRMN